MNDKTARGRPETGDALVEQLNGDVQALAAAVEQLAQRLRIRSAGASPKAHGPPDNEVLSGPAGNDDMLAAAGTESKATKAPLPPGDNAGRGRGPVGIGQDQLRRQRSGPGGMSLTPTGSAHRHRRSTDGGRTGGTDLDADLPAWHAVECDRPRVGGSQLRNLLDQATDGRAGKLLGTPSRIIAVEQQLRELAGDSRLLETGPGGWLS
jgi:hypothetical protein